MKRYVAQTVFLASLTLLASSLAQAQGAGTITVTSQVGVTVAVEAALTILPSPPAQNGGTLARAPAGASPEGRNVTMLTSSDDSLSDYVGTTSFVYFIRTGTVGGSGFIKLQVTQDFAPSGGPSVGAPPSPDDTLRYSCAVSSPGTACSGTQLASISSQTLVGTFVSNTHSAKNGNSASILWMLSNDPLYDTGTYTATITYTISAS